jgi:hypothetical protein
VFYIKQCSSLKVKRHFGGTFRFHLQDRRTSLARKQRKIRFQRRHKARDKAESCKDLKSCLSTNIVRSSQIFLFGAWTRISRRGHCQLPDDMHILESECERVGGRGTYSNNSRALAGGCCISRGSCPVGAASRDWSMEWTGCACATHKTKNHRPRPSPSHPPPDFHFSKHFYYHVLPDVTALQQLTSIRLFFASLFFSVCHGSVQLTCLIRKTIIPNF